MPQSEETWSDYICIAGNPDVEKCHHETPCSKADDVEDVCCEKSEGCCTEQKCFHPGEAL